MALLSLGCLTSFKARRLASLLDQVAYSDFVAEVEAQQINEVLIDGRSLRGESKKWPCDHQCNARKARTLWQFWTKMTFASLPAQMRVVCQVFCLSCYLGFPCCSLSGYGFSLCAKCKAVAEKQWALVNLKLNY